MDRRVLIFISYLTDLLNDGEDFSVDTIIHAYIYTENCEVN